MSRKPETAEVRDTQFADALSERYLAYALSTITSRSLPDVRDGLKPVHRRLLFAMRQLRLDPGSGFKKCARVVGDVMGKYHPHGDQSIYDAMVRMAQEFAARYPLIEGQGNFGNVDGDNAAAMRYTEARLTEYAAAMLEGIDEDSIDFQENYDGTENEPDLLPASVPNLLANGTSGIAVGMATNIPPHNLDELCSASLHLIKFPKATNAKLVELVPGPDFPTGGILMESRASVEESYATGRGSFRLRARWEVEKLKHGQYQVVVTEIPYQVQKGKLVERVAELMTLRKLPMLADIRDESAEDMRIVLEPKSRTIEPEMLMEGMFRHTDMETRFGLNMNVLDGGRIPKVMNLRDVLTAFLDHRHDVLKRRTLYRLDRIAHRLEVLGAYLIAYANLDEIIRIIREEDEPKQVMMKKWKMSDVQAEAILNMRLRALRRLEEVEIRSEHDALTAEKKDLNSLMKDEKKRWAIISLQIKDIQARFGVKTELGKRRTEIGDAPTLIDVPLEAMIEKEPITVICSEKGWIRAARGHVADNGEIKYKEGDRERFVLHAETTDKFLVFGTNGRFYTIGCDKLPGGRGFGDPVRLMTGLGNDQDIVTVMVHKPGRKLLVAASDGRGFVVPEDEVLAQTKGGKQVLNVKGGVEAQSCSVADGDFVAVVGDNRKLLIFPSDEMPTMSRGRGVVLQRYKDGGMSDATVFTLAEGLTWRAGDRSRTETDLKDWIGKRSQAGRIAPRGFSSANRFN
jgi:topoisomerase IV subunit A